MAVDLKLVQWINANKTRLTRAEIAAELTRRGYAEQDILDSYEKIVSQARVTSLQKDMVATILLSVVFPGAGHLYLGRSATGGLLLAVAVVAWLLNLTLIGAILGVPLLFITTIAAVISAARLCNKLNRGEL